MKQTLYQILGVDAKASAADIAAAYERLRSAPDSQWPDANMAGLARQAHEILSDPGRRVAYDASLMGGSARSSGESPIEPERTFIERWRRWIAAIVILAAATWWGMTRREAPPAPTVAPPAAAQPIEAEPEPVARPEDTTPEAVEPKDPVAAAAVAPVAVPARSAEDVFADVASSVARVNVMDASDRLIGTGSGFVVDNEALITSCHVAALGSKLAVKLGEAVMPATIQLADEALDLCRLHVAGMRAPPVAIGSVGTLRTGQRVYAIGAPQGLELTISEGIVSALRKVDEGTVIQTTAPISPGSSGGGLFDLQGRLVGIMTFQHRFGQNLNFALPADWIGQMRARKASEAGWRTAAVWDRSQAASPPTLIVGRWLCRDWTSGRTSQYQFEADGRVSIVAAETHEAAMLDYGVSGKTLRLSNAKQGFALMIEELTSQKMILHGRDRNIACERV
jgi:S1-C subfamily serine protease